MSDGPHRSLNMRKGWKKFAEYADTPAFDTPQTADALVAALTDDWREDVQPEVLDRLRSFAELGGQPTLFAEQKEQDLSEMRDMAAGRPLATTLIDCIERVIARDDAGRDALTAAARKALDMHVTRGVRQVEEHYLRKTDAGRATDVRSRSEEAAQNCPMDALAKSLVTSKPDANLKQSQKHDGLDDGVPL